MVVRRIIQESESLGRIALFRSDILVSLMTILRRREKTGCKGWWKGPRAVTTEGIMDIKY